MTAFRKNAEQLGGAISARSEERLPGATKCGPAQTPIDSPLTALHRVCVEGSSKPLPKGIKREHGRCLESIEAVAAPATVSGEPFANTDHWATGKVEQEVTTREPGDLPSTVAGLTFERGCSSAVGNLERGTPKALTRDRGQPASEGSMSIIGNWLKSSGRLHAAALAILLGLCAPVAANAACEVPDTPNGIPEDVAFKLDVGGARAALARAGIGVGGTYFGEAFHNWGGLKDGGDYFGALYLYTNADMHRLGFWRGLCFFADGFQFHGKGLTPDNVGGLMPVSGLEATPTTRLFQIWLEQTMFNDRVAVRVGQLAVDAEFMLSQGGGNFLNATWGWPSISASDLPQGGPAYPLSAPAVRVAIDATDNLRLMTAVYNSKPAPDCANDDPQVCNPHGLDFQMGDPPLVFAQAEYSYNQKALAGTIKFGGWNDFGKFEHLRFDGRGGLIARTGRNGKPLEDNWGLYGILDQLIWRVPGSEEPQGVGIFARVIGAPADRNLIEWYFAGGITFTGMFRNRPGDALAIGFAYTGISDTVHGFDRDLGEPVARNYEALIEVCYTFEVKPGWSFQPDFQYFFQPGGNVAGQKDAAVVGARTSISF
jgi:porin